MPVARTGRRPKRLVRPPRPMRPDGAERRYEQFLLEYVARIYALARAQVVPAYERALSTLQASAPPPAPARADDDDESAVENLYRTLRAIRLEWRREIPDSRLEQAATEAGREAADVSRENVSRTFQAVLALQPLQTERGVAGQLALFRRQNVELIRSIDSRFFDELDGLVGRALQAGRRPEALSEEIQQRYQVSRSRAQLIARDQLGKLSGQMDRLRQQEAGVTRYTWRTARDQRVRDSHEAREGKVYSWDRPPADGHPGEPIRCRCYAEPVLEDLLEGRTEAAAAPSAAELALPARTLPAAEPAPPVEPAPPTLGGSGGPPGGGGTLDSRLQPQVLGDVPAGFVEEVERSLGVFPQPLQEELIRRRATVTVARDLDELPDRDELRATPAPGHGEGATLANVQGWRDPADNRIYVMFRCELDAGIWRQTTSPGRVAAHEASHVLADAIMENRQVRAAYLVDRNRRREAHLAQRLAYVLQPQQRGLREALAEAIVLETVGSTGQGKTFDMMFRDEFRSLIGVVRVLLKKILLAGTIASVASLVIEGQ